MQRSQRSQVSGFTFPVSGLIGVNGLPEGCPTRRRTAGGRSCAFRPRRRWETLLAPAMHPEAGGWYQSPTTKPGQGGVDHSHQGPSMEPPAFCLYFSSRTQPVKRFSDRRNFLWAGPEPPCCVDSLWIRDGGIPVGELRRREGVFPSACRWPIPGAPSSRKTLSAVAADSRSSRLTRRLPPLRSFAVKEVTGRCKLVRQCGAFEIGCSS